MPPKKMSISAYEGTARPMFATAIPANRWETGSLSRPFSVMTVADGLLGSSARQPRSATAAYLAEHYQGGGILVDDSDSQVVFEAGIPMHEYVATFSGTLWGQALADPGSQVEWVVMHTRSRDDRVSSVLLGNRLLDQEFNLAFEDASRGQGVYHRRPTA